MDPKIGYALAAATALIWGLIVIPVKRARTSGLLGLGVSLPVGVVTLLAFTVIARPSFPAVEQLLSWQGAFLALGGICQFPLATACYYESIRAAEVSTVVPLTRLKAVFVVILVFVIGIETVPVRIVIACAAGLAGAIVLTRETRGPRTAHQGNLGRGIALALLTCCAWAAGDVLIRLGKGNGPSLPATLVSLSAGAVAYFAAVVVSGRLPAILGMPARDTMLYALHGFFSFGLAYFAFFTSWDYIGMTPAVIVTSTWPAVSFVVGLILFRERLTWSKALGFVLLMAGACFAMEW